MLTGIWTGIGSRTTPEPVMALMTAVAYDLCLKGMSLRSGGAGGADSACEHGVKVCGELNDTPLRMEIYLPWKKFNGRPTEPPYYHKYELAEQAEAIAARIHPAWHNCNHTARKLHTRNVFQVLGMRLDRPSDFVLCWTRAGLAAGGTRTAIVLAQEYDVPILNLADYKYVDWKAADVLDKIYSLMELGD